jgi:hypothetical protein
MFADLKLKRFWVPYWVTESTRFGIRAAECDALSMRSRPPSGIGAKADLR